MPPASSRSSAPASSRWPTSRLVPFRATPGVIENATVVVEGNRISAIGPSSSVTVPAGATRIDVKGKTIMPGIIDVHGHLGGESSGLIAQTSWPLAANLAFGVTTSHDPSNDSETVFTNAELVRAGREVGPRVLFDRHHSLRRRDAVQGRRRELRGCALARQAAEGARRDQRQELQPAAPRRAPDDRQGVAGARDPRCARRRSLLYMNQTPCPRWSHRRRALVARAAAVQGHGRALCQELRWLYPDPHRRLRRPFRASTTGISTLRSRLTFATHRSRTAGQPSTLVAARTPRTIASAMRSAASDPRTVNGISDRCTFAVETAKSWSPSPVV